MSAYWNIPTLRTYQDALNHYNNVKPMRGDPMKTKPIGSRKHKYMSIYQNEVDKSLHCKLGGTTVVRYDADGTISIPVGLWYSSNEMARSVLGATIIAEFGKHWINCQYEVDGVNRHGEIALHGVQENLFKRLDNNDLFFSNPVFATIHTIDRKKGNDLMKPYKPFIKYVQGMVKLKEGNFTAEEIGENVDYNKIYDYTDILPELDMKTTEGNLKAFFMLVQNIRTNQYWRGTTHVTLPRIREVLRHQIYLHHQEHVGDILVEEVVTDGRRVKDTNADLFHASNRRIVALEARQNGF